MRRYFYTAVVLALILLLGARLTDTTYLFKALRTTYLRGNTDATIYDFPVQETRIIETGTPQPWALHEMYNEVGLSEENEQWHKELKSIAFLVIKDGKILTEKYFAEGGVDHLSGVWSITKTYTSLLILKAIEDGLIESVDDPVKKYLPEWETDQEETLTLRHLASMSAGLYWEEWEHKPWALITKMNFYDDLEKFTVEDMYAIGEPGRVQHYNSGATQMLGTVLDRVLGDVTISDYLSEKFWKPLGYEYEGLFVLDSRREGNEKTYGGIVATARDVSRLGQLILDDGIWTGDTLLRDADMDLIKTLPYNNATYTYGIWTGVYEGARYYYQAGFRGQYCISFPKYGLVITRLGHHASPREEIELESVDAPALIREALRIVQQSGA